VVEEKTCCYVKGVVKCVHGFGPLSEVIDFHDIVLVSITGWRITSHEINSPFTEGDDGDEWM
jgi:hypothetical protein